MSVKDLTFETLRVTVDDNVLTVTLDGTGNPLNLFTWQRMEELDTLMSQLRDETAARAIAATGSGRYFSGGAAASTSSRRWTRPNQPSGSAGPAASCARTCWKSGSRSSVR
jgi:enoyl-CoA hydratase/carnithine racemase